jgi:hypothetical protein
MKTGKWRLCVTFYEERANVDVVVVAGTQS